jgi:rhamnogalacturonyl hydrolase YesR
MLWHFYLASLILCFNTAAGTISIDQSASAASTLHKSVDVNRRNKEDGLLYYTHPQWSYLEGTYSLAPFYVLGSVDGSSSRDFNVTATDDMLHQPDLSWPNNGNASTGLLVHRYDESLTAVWAHPITGASSHFWGRTLSWFAMALIDKIEHSAHNCRYR